MKKIVMYSSDIQSIEIIAEGNANKPCILVTQADGNYLECKSISYKYDNAVVLKGVYYKSSLPAHYLTAESPCLGS